MFKLHFRKGILQKNPLKSSDFIIFWIDLLFLIIWAVFAQKNDILAKK